MVVLSRLLAVPAAVAAARANVENAMKGQKFLQTDKNPTGGGDADYVHDDHADNVPAADGSFAPPVHHSGGEDMELHSSQWDPLLANCNCWEGSFCEAHNDAEGGHCQAQVAPGHSCGQYDSVYWGVACEHEYDDVSVNPASWMGVRTFFGHKTAYACLPEHDDPSVRTCQNAAICGEDCPRDWSEFGEVRIVPDAAEKCIVGKTGEVLQCLDDAQTQVTLTEDITVCATMDEYLEKKPHLRNSALKPAEYDHAMTSLEHMAEEKTGLCPVHVEPPPEPAADSDSESKESDSKESDSKASDSTETAPEPAASTEAAPASTETAPEPTAPTAEAEPAASTETAPEPAPEPAPAPPPPPAPPAEQPPADPAPAAPAAPAATPAGPAAGSPASEQQVTPSDAGEGDIPQDVETANHIANVGR